MVGESKSSLENDGLIFNCLIRPLSYGLERRGFEKGPRLCNTKDVQYTRMNQQLAIISYAFFRT